MKWLLIAAIKLYKKLPKFLKPQCLFKEHCSSFVERIAGSEGVIAGMAALKTRIHQCRPTYEIYFDHETQTWVVLLADGSIESASALADFVMQPYRDVFGKAVVR